MPLIRAFNDMKDMAPITNGSMLELHVLFIYQWTFYQHVVVFGITDVHASQSAAIYTRLRQAIGAV
jgi:hypothetical protein